MRNFRKWLLAVWLLVSVSGVQADERSKTLLAALQRRVEQMAGYAVTFTLQIDEREMAGRYVVRGEHYYMQVGEAEVYADGEARYEVDPTKHEVVVDVVDLSSHNMLQNPTRAFTFLEHDFDHAFSSEAAGQATLLLRPKAYKSLSEVTLVLDTKSFTPRLLVYDTDGDRLQIVITSFEESVAPIPSFDPARYIDFELIDFR